MPVLRFEAQDKIVLKKAHPCGANVFTVLKGGTDVKIVCDTCQRALTLNREKLEKMIKNVIPNNKFD